MTGLGVLLLTCQSVAIGPGMFCSSLRFFHEVAGVGDLDVQLKILVPLRFAVLKHGDYTLSHLWSAGTANSIPAELMTAAADGTYAGPDDRIRAALEVTQLVTIVATTVSRTEETDIISAAVRTNLQSLFTPADRKSVV